MFFLLRTVISLRLLHAKFTKRFLKTITAPPPFNSLCLNEPSKYHAPPLRVTSTARSTSNERLRVWVLRESLLDERAAPAGAFLSGMFDSRNTTQWWGASFCRQPTYWVPTFFPILFCKISQKIISFLVLYKIYSQNISLARALKIGSAMVFQTAPDQLLWAALNKQIKLARVITPDDEL